MTIRDLVERLAEAGYDGLDVMILDGDGYFCEVAFVNPTEIVASRHMAVIVAKRVEQQ